MVLPVTALNAQDAYDQLRNGCRNVMSYMQGVQEQIGTGSVDPNYFLNAVTSSISLIALAQSIITNTTIAPLVVSLYQASTNPALDVAGNLATAIGALQAAVAAMVADYPKDAEGHMLDRKLGADGGVQMLPFVGSSLGNSNAAISAFLATVS